VEPCQQPAIIEWSRHLVDSYRRWLGKDLLPQGKDDSFLAQSLYKAPFVVVSHGTQPDPILNYGNQTALDLWELDWPQFTQTPSRQTAEPAHRHERATMLAQLSSRGYIDNYQGIRISSRDRRFRINRAIVWNVVDGDGTRLGQAATFAEWQFLD
jgi:hypothetical protein